MGNLMIKHLNKRMFRKGIQIIILVYSFLGCNLEYTPYSFVKSDEVIELRFGRKMSESLLDSIKQVLKTSGVELDYSELKFDGNKLSRLAFKIEYNGNFGEAKTNFVNKGKSFGFRIEPKNNFMMVGELNSKP